jgi:hypothetical protein
MESIHIPDKKQRVGIITRNFFLHIHATRVHVHSMKPTYTFGLGIILGFLFLLMVFTGVILMIYYTPFGRNGLPVGKGHCECGARRAHHPQHAPLGFPGHGHCGLPAPGDGSFIPGPIWAIDP